MQVHWRKIGIWFLKILLFVVAWGYVVYKFMGMDQDISFLFTDSHFSSWIFIVVCFLMPCNWGLESKKWQQLVSCSTPISYSKALSGVLVGLPLALVTPNRVGEICGRAVVLDKGRGNAIFATFLGSLMQLSATIIFGLLGALLYLLCCPTTNMALTNVIVFSVFAIICLVIIVIVCHDKRWFRVIFLKMVGKKWYKKLLHVARLFSFRDCLRALLISLLRYVVFATQFGLLVHSFIPEITVIQVFIGITLMYLLTTIIPTSILGEVGIRGSVAMVVFELFTSNVSIVFQISLLIWLVNIVLPTLTGSLILLQKKVS